MESGNSSDYLLPIGPLTYFEKWYKDCRPNKYWINRYNNSESAPSEKLNESASTLYNLQKFLRRSALQLVVTRTFMKYGAAKIARIAALAAFLVLSGVAAYRWHVRQNDVVLGRIITEGTFLLKDQEASAGSKAFFVT